MENKERFPVYVILKYIPEDSFKFDLKSLSLKSKSAQKRQLTVAPQSIFLFSYFGCIKHWRAD